MVEYLISGILFLVALIILAISLFPNGGFPFFSKAFGFPSCLTNPILLIPILASIAYGFGILSELIALNAVEWVHKKIKRDRLDKFVDSNPLISKNGPIDLEEIKRLKKGYTGVMRFYVLMKNPTLYNEIESQHTRLRITRVLFLFEIILFLSIGRQVLRTPTVEIITLLGFIILLMIINYFGIKYRFNRYDESIERAYKVLLLN
jgi:hypothetical protein